MLKVLYVIGTGSVHDNVELRWSLRSLEKFCTCPVEPVVVGEVPTWFKGEALTLPDRSERKEKNIMAKILAAVDARLVDGLFQVSADDHFWIRPVNLDEQPVWFREPILPEYTLGNNYARALAGTRRLLLEAGFPALNTTVHANAWANAEHAQTVRDLCETAEEPFVCEYGAVAWAVWPNVTVIGQKAVPIRYKRDIKIRDASYIEFLAEIEDTPVCSVNDRAFENPDIVRFLSELYAGKSRWEK